MPGIKGSRGQKTISAGVRKNSGISKLNYRISRFVAAVRNKKGTDHRSIQALDTNEMLSTVSKRLYPVLMANASFEKDEQSDDIQNNVTRWSGSYCMQQHCSNLGHIMNCPIGNITISSKFMVGSVQVEKYNIASQVEKYNIASQVEKYSLVPRPSKLGEKAWAGTHRLRMRVIKLDIIM